MLGRDARLVFAWFKSSLDLEKIKQIGAVPWDLAAAL